LSWPYLNVHVKKKEEMREKGRKRKKRKKKKKTNCKIEQVKIG